MADVYEQNLPSKANLNVSTTGDYIRVVGNDNNSYKQLVNDVAKKIIENYTNSSLAGSSQSVKSALDSLNSKSMHAIQGNVSSFDSIPDGVSCGYFVTASGVPEGWYLCMKNSPSATSKELYLFGTSERTIYTAQYRNSSWGTVSQFPRSKVYTPDASGNFASVIYQEGFYMLLAKHNTDATAYYEGVAYKVSGQNAIHTMLGNSKITMRVQNVNGTIIFNYNDAMSTDITLTVFKFA